MQLYITIAAVAIIAVATVFLLKKQVNLGFIMLLDSVAIVVLARMPVEEALKHAVRGAFSDNTLMLIMVLFLIMMLENIMRVTGMVKSMVESLKELVGSNRIAAAVMPTVLGLLPSPGGARFSCPMVSEVTGDNTDDDNKAYINYWFRHVWLDGFILYPGVILASKLLDVSVVSYFLHLIPFITLNMVVGALKGLRKIRKEVIIRTRSRSENLKIFILSLLPVVILITAYTILLNYTEYALEIAAGSVVVALFIIKRFSLKQVWRTMKEAFHVKFVMIIIGVMVFKEILLQSGAIDGLPGLLNRYGIPAGVLFILFPFIGGLSSGITVSYVSLTYPLLIPLGLGQNMWGAAIAYTAGSIGCMVSPLHLCSVMTSDYFHTKLGKLLAGVAAAEAALVLFMGALLFFVT